MSKVAKTVRVSLTNGAFKLLCKWFSEKNEVPSDCFSDRERETISELEEEGCLYEHVSDWSYQESTWIITNIGKQVLHK